jgi:lipoyl-dependent peroxiredoxin
MPELLYTAVATSTGDGRAGGRAVTDSAVVAEVSVAPAADGRFALTAALHVHIGGGISQEIAESLASAAHAMCPYSVATRDNVPVTVTTTVA